MRRLRWFRILGMWSLKPSPVYEGRGGGSHRCTCPQASSPLNGAAEKRRVGVLTEVGAQMRSIGTVSPGSDGG